MGFPNFFLHLNTMGKKMYDDLLVSPLTVAALEHGPHYI